MELVRDIDNLLDAIDHEIVLLERVARQMSNELDTQATHDMVGWIASWNPGELLDLNQKGTA